MSRSQHLCRGRWWGLEVGGWWGVKQMCLKWRQTGVARATSPWTSRPVTGVECNSLSRAVFWWWGGFEPFSRISFSSRPQLFLSARRTTGTPVACPRRDRGGGGAIVCAYCPWSPACRVQVETGSRGQAAVVGMWPRRPGNSTGEACTASDSNQGAA